MILSLFKVEYFSITPNGERGFLRSRIADSEKVANRVVDEFLVKLAEESKKTDSDLYIRMEIRKPTTIYVDGAIYDYKDSAILYSCYCGGEIKKHEAKLHY